MKITTLQQNFGKSLNIFRGITLEFGNNGICEIKDEKLAEEIINHYPESFWNLAKEKEVEVKKAKTAMDKVNENLSREIEFLKNQNAELIKKVETAEADKQKWADLAVELEGKVQSALKEVDDIKATSEQTIKGLELKVELIDSSMESLIEVCENAGYPKGEWESKDKIQLIEYLLSK